MYLISCGVILKVGKCVLQFELKRMQSVVFSGQLVVPVLLERYDRRPVVPIVCWLYVITRGDAFEHVLLSCDAVVPAFVWRNYRGAEVPHFLWRYYRVLFGPSERILGSCGENWWSERPN